MTYALQMCWLTVCGACIRPSGIWCLETVSFASFTTGKQFYDIFVIYFFECFFTQMMAPLFVSFYLVFPGWAKDTFNGKWSKWNTMERFSIRRMLVFSPVLKPSITLQNIIHSQDLNTFSFLNRTFLRTILMGENKSHTDTATSFFFVKFFEYNLYVDIISEESRSKTSI